ncbi:MAG: cellulase family glycosylhydrolase [bacterium]
MKVRYLGSRLWLVFAAAACGSAEGGAPIKPIVPADTQPTPTTLQPAPAIHVAGNRLVDGAGRTVRLRGVNRSGTEFMCAQGRGIFDGPSDSTSVRAIAQWHVNVVRVPLNEACWLAINGVNASYAGATYQQAIVDYVATLNRYGIVAIVEPHWTAPGTTIPLAQQPMPNRDHTVDFWKQVATTFRTNNAVIFDLFNEPYPDNNADTPEAWRCWRDGGTCNGMNFQAAGMQELVTAVRSTGATNVIMIGGVEYSARLSKWLANKPVDPLNNLAASWHVYNFSWCNTRSCWDSDALPVSQQVPLILGELGQNDFGSAFNTSLMDWMDAIQGSYLAWTWDVWGTPLDLITKYDGTPTPYGATFRARFGG